MKRSSLLAVAAAALAAPVAARPDPGPTPTGTGAAADEAALATEASAPPGMLSARGRPGRAEAALRRSGLEGRRLDFTLPWLTPGRGAAVREAERMVEADREAFASARNLSRYQTLFPTPQGNTP